VGLDQGTLAVALLKVISVAVALLADTVLFAIVFSRLSGAKLTWRQVRSGALLAAVGFELLKLLGTFLIGRVTQNQLYATFRRRGGPPGVDELRGQAHDLRRVVDGYAALLAGASRPRRGGRRAQHGPRAGHRASRPRRAGRLRAGPGGARRHPGVRRPAEAGRLAPGRRSARQQGPVWRPWLMRARRSAD
jgi:hypothetical protein